MGGIHAPAASKGLPGKWVKIVSIERFVQPMMDAWPRRRRGAQIVVMCWAPEIFRMCRAIWSFHQVGKRDIYSSGTGTMARWRREVDAFFWSPVHQRGVLPLAAEAMLRTDCGQCEPNSPGPHDASRGAREGVMEALALARPLYRHLHQINNSDDDESAEKNHGGINVRESLRAATTMESQPLVSTAIQIRLSELPVINLGEIDGYRDAELVQQGDGRMRPPYKLLSNMSVDALAQEAAETSSVAPGEVKQA
ncbi:hypothetical protein K458DRAFT_401053 [Lentithecium fluviatile CBS 122367]|uniref:Uncharacterized protein n=1 Tax=Lentithecium fluviatile CBS 122367 TaxID=1168545 RepID=A0A6G1JFQ2_9PLEO|nr:hypothetical protein K458DRAFT_401053 [Lentithecium fluviatile CBS 122367]